MLPAVESALERDDGVTALALCEAAVERDPRDAVAHQMLGLVLAASGLYPDAVRAGQRACELAGQDSRTWSDLGRIHAMHERFEEAVPCFERAVRQDSRDADAWHNLGTAFKHLKRWDAAFHALKQALLLDSCRADTYLNLGGLLIQSQQFDDALECFERAARYDPTLARAQSRLAAQLSTRGKLQRAQALFRTSLSLDPNHVDGWLGLGHTLEDIGDAAGALGCYRNALAREAGRAVALGRYLALLPAEAPPQLLQAVHHTLEDAARTDEHRALIGYGLAKYHDRRAEPEGAVHAARIANASRRRHSGVFDRDAFDARVASMIETYDTRFFAQRRDFGLGTDQPVFIVGLPRSGTTLVEQILASHPMLHGGGELPDLPRIAASGCRAAPWKAASLLEQAQARTSAFAYLRALREGAPRGALRITDKSPFNFFQLAMAALLFPQARVIHCRRSARDNAMSIWLENFNQDQSYATDFDDLAHLRRGYERLMEHWHEALPLPILDVDYEALVADVESETRRLIEFVGAPWDRRCLDFHRNHRAVQTPSRWQVRERIYTRSVNRWRSYAPHLPELLRAFDASDEQRAGRRVPST